VGEAQANGSSHVSFNIFTKNAVVDETQTTGSGHDSMDTSPQNDGVEEAHTPVHHPGGMALSTHSLRMLEWMEHKQ
jgi:hypothetical protein